MKLVSPHSLQSFIWADLLSGGIGKRIVHSSYILCKIWTLVHGFYRVRLAEGHYSEIKGFTHTLEGMHTYT